MNSVKTLTKAEEQLMQVLWKLGKGFLKEIIDATPEPKPHSNTTATILKILVEKGFVEYSVHGRNNLYEPLISQAEYGKKSVNQLIKGYFDGSPARPVSYTHLRAHETDSYLVCRLLLEKKKKNQ